MSKQHETAFAPITAVAFQPDFEVAQSFLQIKMEEKTRGDWSLIAKDVWEMHLDGLSKRRTWRLVLSPKHNMARALKWIQEHNLRMTNVELMHESASGGSVGFFPIPGLINWLDFNWEKITAWWLPRCAS